MLNVTVGARTRGRSTTRISIGNMFLAICLQNTLKRPQKILSYDLYGSGAVEDGFQSPYTLLGNYIETATSYRAVLGSDYGAGEKENPVVMISPIDCEDLTLR
ncbi:hypothetical protein R3P38DRAFT_2786626 [Favolaschia claudopus]|uniref:Uncharacterized protein n=1 Tax=Favolaschia claudopus TaxID=2862362 RepID=A0AAW0AUA4_9AGAR